MSQFVVGLGEVLWDVFPKGKRLGANKALAGLSDGRTISTIVKKLLS
jgi:hypothetical protein